MTKVLVTRGSLEDIADAIRTKLGVQTTYKPSQMASAIETITSAVLTTKSITQNGTYAASSDSADGYSSVTVSVSGGGIQSISKSDWDALTPSQKRSYGLVAIIESESGYNRGDVVYGEYLLNAIDSGWASSSKTFAPSSSGTFALIVIAINSEASTKELNISTSVNNTSVTASYEHKHNYTSSGDNKRDYRVCVYDVTVQTTDSISISLSNKGNYASFVYALVETEYTTASKTLTTPDGTTSGQNNADGMVVYGTFNSQNSGTINVESYTHGQTVTTASPGSDYKSSYIMWFTEAT